MFHKMFVVEFTFSKNAAAYIRAYLTPSQASMVERLAKKVNVTL